LIWLTLLGNGVPEKTNNRMIAFRDFWLGLALERPGTFLTIPIMRLRKPLRSQIIGFFYASYS
jgi:hypothetical protein